MRIKIKWYFFTMTAWVFANIQSPLVNTLPPNLKSRCKEFSLSDEDCSNSVYLPQNEFRTYLKNANTPIIKEDYCNGDKCVAIIYKDETKCGKCVDRNCLLGCKRFIHTDRMQSSDRMQNGNIPVDTSKNNVITVTQEITKTIERSTTPVKMVTSTLLSSIFSTSTKTVTETNVSTIKKLTTKTSKPITKYKTVTIEADNEDEKQKEVKGDLKRESKRDEYEKKVDLKDICKRDEHKENDYKESGKVCKDVEDGDESKRHIKDISAPTKHADNRQSDTKRSDTKHADTKHEDTKQQIITLTREIPTTITLDRPITLYREVTTTITSEVPIINYKVTTFTKSFISTIEKVSTTTERLSVVESVPMTITSVSTMTSIVTTTIKKELEKKKEDEKKEDESQEEDGKKSKLKRPNKDDEIPSTVSLTTIIENDKSIRHPKNVEVKTITSIITIPPTTSSSKVEYKTVTSTVTMTQKESDVEKLIPLLKEFLTIENKPKKKKKKVNPQTAKKVHMRTVYTRRKKCAHKKAKCIDCDSTCED